MKPIKTIDKQTKDFFDMLHIDIETKHFYCFHTIPNTGGKKCFGQSSKFIKDVFTSNRFKYNIYFYVNSGKEYDKSYKFTITSKAGKTFSKSISKEIESRKIIDNVAFNAFYFDFDLHDNNGKHFAGQELISRKDNLYNLLITRLPLSPSAIVESGNGYHVYYALQENDRYISAQVWKNTETQLINYIYCNISTDIDFAVSDTARVLRIPNTYHHKDDSAIDTKITIKHMSGLRYSLQDLHQNFLVVMLPPSRASNPKNPKAKQYTKKSVILTAIKNLDYSYFKTHIQAINTNMSIAEKVSYIQAYDMIYFLQLPVNQRDTFSDITYTDKTL